MTSGRRCDCQTFSVHPRIPIQECDHVRVVPAARGVEISGLAQAVILGLVITVLAIIGLSRAFGWHA